MGGQLQAIGVAPSLCQLDSNAAPKTPSGGFNLEHFSRRKIALKNEIDFLGKQGSFTSSSGQTISMVNPFVSNNTLSDMIIPGATDSLYTYRVIIAQKQLVLQLELLKVLGEELQFLNNNLGKDQAKLLRAREEEYQSLKNTVQKASARLNLAKLSVTGSVSNDALSLIIKHSAESGLSNHLIEGAVVAQGLCLPLQIHAVNTTVSELKSISKEKQKIDQDIKRLKKEKGHPVLIEVLEIKSYYLQKVKYANKAAELVKNICGLVKVSGGVGTTALKLTALKAGAIAVGKVLWPLILGAFGIGTTLYVSSEKAYIRNAFKKLPEYLRLKKTESELKNIHNQIHRAEDGHQIATELMRVQKLALKPTLRALETAIKMEEQAKTLVNNLLHKTKISNQEKYNKELIMAKERLELAKQALNQAITKHSENVNNVAKLQDLVERGIESFKKVKTEEINQLWAKKLTIAATMKNMDQQALEQWKADQVGASVQDMIEVKQALHEDLKHPKTREAFINYLVAHGDDGAVEKFHKDPVGYLMDFMFQ